MGDTVGYGPLGPPPGPGDLVVSPCISGVGGFPIFIPCDNPPPLLLHGASPLQPRQPIRRLRYPRVVSSSRCPFTTVYISLLLIDGSIYCYYYSS